MKKVAVIYWSGTGNTEKMAKAIAKTADADLYTAAEFDVEKLTQYDALAFGCPSMGAEQLEESEFQPMWDGVSDQIGNRNIGLFGSWGWGDGAWMETWEDECAAKGIGVVGTVICQETPDTDVLAECEALGRKLIE